MGSIPLLLKRSIEIVVFAWLSLVEQRSCPRYEILSLKAISLEQGVMCTYLVTRHSADGAFLGYVRACPSFASAEVFVGWLNLCRAIAGDAYSYGVEVSEQFGEARSDAFLSLHGIYGLI